MFNQQPKIILLRTIPTVTSYYYIFAPNFDILCAKIWRGRGGEDNSDVSRFHQKCPLLLVPSPGWGPAVTTVNYLANLIADTANLQAPRRLEARTFLLTFFWHIFWQSFLTNLLTHFLTFCLAYFLAFFLTYLLAFFFARWRPGAARPARKLPGGGPALPTPLASSPLRSGAAHCNLELPVEVRRCPLQSEVPRSGPALPTAIWSFRLRSGDAHCDLELTVEIRRCAAHGNIKLAKMTAREEGREERGGEGEEGGGGGRGGG